MQTTSNWESDTKSLHSRLVHWVRVQNAGYIQRTQSVNSSLRYSIVVKIAHD